MTRTADARWGMIADNLRHSRGVRGWTQQDLADHSGVSRRMIAAVESAQHNVSLVTLDRLASALGTSFVQLFTPPDADVRRGELVWEGKHPGSAATLLGSHPARRGVELWRWSLAAAGESYRAEADPPGMHELLYVLSGELSVELAGDTHSEKFCNSYGIFPSRASMTQCGFRELEKHPVGFRVLRKWTESV